VDVNDVVAARVEAARLRAESAKKARAARKAARARGVAQRHAAKLRAQAARRPDPPGVATPPATSCSCGRTPDPGICPISHGGGLPAGGHCACICTDQPRETP